jgi:hypothetical protein
MARVVYRVVREGCEWRLSRDDAPIDSFMLKANAVAAGRERALLEWRQSRQRVQLVVHRHDGSIEYVSAAGWFERETTAVA